MSRKTSPILLVQYSNLQNVKYGFGDASSGVFGATIKVESVLDIETGTWISLGSQNSPNFIKLSNFMYKLEKDYVEGNLDGTETFMFTYNITDETAYHNGTSYIP